MSDSTWTHLDDLGRARMVDVGDKPPTRRTARARALVRVGPAIAASIQDGKVPKGDVLTVARIAGIQAAKQTANLVPLCHPLLLDHVDVDAAVDLVEGTVRLESRVACHGATGVEMEAVIAVSIAAATIYDMCKSMDRSIRIDGIEVVEKSGGRSGSYSRP
jgi:cyclic pyranopterin phosphate synthase